MSPELRIADPAEGEKMAEGSCWCASDIQARTVNESAHKLQERPLPAVMHCYWHGQSRPPAVMMRCLPRTNPSDLRLQSLCGIEMEWINVGMESLLCQ